MEIADRLNAVGRDISILIQPMDLVKQLKKGLKALKGYKDYIVMWRLDEFSLNFFKNHIVSYELYRTGF